MTPLDDPDFLSSGWIDDEGRDAWCDRVRDAVDAIEGGLLDKVVLARSRRAEAPPGHRFDPLQTIATLNTCHPELAVFSLAEADGVFLGATPERLVRIDQGAMHTHALAGTAASESEVFNDAKLSLEHRCVVEQMVADLALMVQVGRGHPTARRGNLVHLETELSELPGCLSLQLSTPSSGQLWRHALRVPGLAR